MKYATFIFISILLIIHSCTDEDETTTSGYIRITTKEVTDITDKGVVFHASFDGEKIAKIRNHGFVWGKGESVSTSSSFIINLGEPTFNEFSANVGYQLEAGEYYARAFINTIDNITFYGERIKFKSLGSEGPQITNVNTIQLKQCDTLIIEGRNFIERIYPQVTINKKPQFNFLFEAKKGIIKVKVTDILPDKPLIQVKFNEFSTSKVVSVKQEPIIATLISPEAVGPGDTVKIQLNQLPDCLESDLQITPIEPCYNCGLTKIDKAKKQVNYILSQSCLPGKLSLAMVAKDSAIFKTPELKIKSVVVKSVNPSIIKLGEPLIIEGEYLNSTNPNTVLRIGDNNYYPEFVSANQLIFNLPPYTPFEVDGTINAKLISCTNIDIDIQLKVALPKITSIYPTKIVTGNEIITVKGENFYPDFQTLEVCDASWPVQIIESTENEMRFKINDAANLDCLEKKVKIVFYNYTVESAQGLTIDLVNAFTQLSSFPAGSRLHSQGFSIGNLGFIALGEIGNTVLTELWQYNPTSDTWTQKNDFPGAPRRYATSFVIDDKAYVGLGWDIYNNPLNDLWEYDVVSDTWVEIAEFPNIGVHAISFSLNGKAYVGRSSIDLSAIGFFEYDPQLNSWNKKNDMPNPLNDPYYNPSFQSESKGYYFSSGQMFIYDPILDSWDSKLPCGYSFYPGILSLYGDRLYQLSTSDVYSYSITDPDCIYNQISMRPSFNYGLTGFRINNKVYLGLGLEDERFWLFEPSKLE